jgi:hypothetical protein
MYQNRVESGRNNHHVLWQFDIFSQAAGGVAQPALRYRCARTEPVEVRLSRLFAQSQ